MGRNAWLIGALLPVGMLIAAGAEELSSRAPFINTWLVAGTFDNDENNTGFERDWVNELYCEPLEAGYSAGSMWRYFDDRLFSRNLDDYQDLFSYFQIKRGQSVAAKVAYAHVYVHSVREQAAQLRVGADTEFKAWVNGAPVASSAEDTPYKDLVKADVKLREGWNRLLLKIGNRQNGRFGFYARLTNPDGNRLDGITYSVNGGWGPLMVTTRSMPEVGPLWLPAGYVGCAYVGADAVQASEADSELKDFLRKPEIALSSTDFLLMAQGGTAPYRWSLEGSGLPEGLRLEEDGAIRGTIAPNIKFGDYTFKVVATDQAGVTAWKILEILVYPRPTQWYEEARLVGLIHHPESMPENAFDEFADLMKRQGYGLGMVISYNNGDYAYRWPSIYQPDNPLGDLVGKYETALEKAGLKFGMYIGNLNGPNHGGDNGAILLVEDALRRYKPAAFWFDWAGWDGVSLDAIYSMIKSYAPETLVVLNGMPTMSNGDWDVICLEGWGAWGDKLWQLWPFHFEWPKPPAIESWRLVADPAFEYSQGVQPDWQDYLRVQIALICEGFVANIDHSPTIKSALNEQGRLNSLADSPLIQAHQKMAEWVDQGDRPPLYESYTHVNPGPFKSAAWGYNVISTAPLFAYLHLMKTPYGKTGKPDSPTLTVGPVLAPVQQVGWMNRGDDLKFEQKGEDLVIDISNVTADPIDTIIKIRFKTPHPPAKREALPQPGPIPAGNLATWKPARLLSNTDQHALPPSAFHLARYGVDGIPFTFACGGDQWAWTYQVDLQQPHSVRRVVVHFGPGFPTEYKVHLSEDGSAWKTVAEVTGCKAGTQEHAFDPTPARYVRVQSVKPDGPNQEGIQMNIAELEVYE